MVFPTTISDEHKSGLQPKQSCKREAMPPYILGRALCQCASSHVKQLLQAHHREWLGQREPDRPSTARSRRPEALQRTSLNRGRYRGISKLLRASVLALAPFPIGCAGSHYWQLVNIISIIKRAYEQRQSRAIVLIVAAMCLGVCRAEMDAQSVAGAAGQGRPRPHADARTFGMFIAFVILMVIIFVGMGLRRFAGG